MAAELEKRGVSLTALRELRRLYDHTSHHYDQLRIKTLALIAGETGIVSFIFSNTGEKVPLIPAEAYGKIFFWAGVALISIAFLLFLSVISTVEWLIPLDLPEVEKLHKRHQTLESFLEYIINDYVECIKHCLSKVKIRTARFNWAIYTLVVGVIVLMVLKFRG
jgi:hypothetical protein